MAQIICEVCGASDMIKQDGVFVCNVCNCKYSLEEVRKMLSGDVSAPLNAAPVSAVSAVAVAQPCVITNSMTNARKAVEREDFDEALRYYRTVKESDPDNIEAELYIALCNAKGTMIQNNIFEREQKFNILSNTLGILAKELSADDIKNRELIDMFSRVVFQINATSFVFNNSDLGYANNKDKTYALFENLHLTFIDILQDFNNQNPRDYVFEAILKHCNFLRDSGFVGLDTLQTMSDMSLRVEKEYNDYKFRLEDPEGYAEYMEAKNRKINDFDTYYQQKTEAGALVNIDELIGDAANDDMQDIINNVFNTLAPGETFVMGTYNGSPIVWLIVHNDAYTSSSYQGTVSVISVNSLFKMAHSNAKTGVWNNSFVRAHINSEEFMKNVLAAGLRNLVRKQITDELITIPDADMLNLLPTGYRAARLLGDQSGNNSWWWTKTPNTHRFQTIFRDVDPMGNLNAGHYADNGNIGVRIMINFKVINE